MNEPDNVGIIDGLLMTAKMQEMIKYVVVLREIRFRVYKQNEAREKAKIIVMNEI
jgi:hypothetical protein